MAANVSAVNRASIARVGEGGNLACARKMIAGGRWAKASPSPAKAGEVRAPAPASAGCRPKWDGVWPCAQVKRGFTLRWSVRALDAGKRDRYDSRNYTDFRRPIDFNMVKMALNGERPPYKRSRLQRTIGRLPANERDGENTLPGNPGTGS